MPWLGGDRSNPNDTGGVSSGVGGGVQAGGDFSGGGISAGGWGGGVSSGNSLGASGGMGVGGGAAGGWGGVGAGMSSPIGGGGFANFGGQNQQFGGGGGTDSFGGGGSGGDNWGGMGGGSSIQQQNNLGMPSGGLQAGAMQASEPVGQSNGYATTSYGEHILNQAVHDVFSANPDLMNMVDVGKITGRVTDRPRAFERSAYPSEVSNAYGYATNPRDMLNEALLGAAPADTDIPKNNAGMSSGFGRVPGSSEIAKNYMGMPGGEIAKNNLGVVAQGGSSTQAKDIAGNTVPMNDLGRFGPRGGANVGEGLGVSGTATVDVMAPEITDSGRIAATAYSEPRSFMSSGEMNKLSGLRSRDNRLIEAADRIRTDPRVYDSPESLANAIVDTSEYGKYRSAIPQIDDSGRISAAPYETLPQWNDSGRIRGARGGETVIDQNGNVIDQNGNFVSPNGNFVAKNNLGIPAGSTVDQNGTVIDQNGSVITPNGNVITLNGNIVSPNGTVIGKTGPVLGAKGRSGVAKGKSAGASIVPMTDVPRGTVIAKNPSPGATYTQQRILDRTTDRGRIRATPAAVDLTQAAYDESTGQPTMPPLDGSQDMIDLPEPRIMVNAPGEPQNIVPERFSNYTNNRLMPSSRGPLADRADAILYRIAAAKAAKRKKKVA